MSKKGYRNKLWINQKRQILNYFCHKEVIGALNA